MEYIIGILLLISFVGLAVYAVRGGNLMMGMLIMAIIWKYICDKSGIYWFLSGNHGYQCC